MFFKFELFTGALTKSPFFYYIVQDSSPGVKPEAKMIFIAVPPKVYLVLTVGVSRY